MFPSAHRAAIESLSDEVAGKLFKAAFSYYDGEDVAFEDGQANLAWLFIKASIDETKEEETVISEINSQNGQRGGRPRREEIEELQQQEEPRERRSRREYPEGFRAFWEVYPRKKDKGRAYQCYSSRIADGFSPEELLQAATAYRDECERRRTEEKFIKHAATFLSSALPFMDYISSDNAQQTETGYGEVDLSTL